MSGDDDSTTETTFTRAQMAKMVAQQVKDKLAAALAEYGDLDELKSKAAAADANESKIEQVLSKLTAAEKRASDAEAANLRRAVADELGLTPRQAGRLKGSTRDELLADGEEMIEDMGIKRKTPPATKTKDATGEATEEQDETDEQQDETDDATATTTVTAPPARTRAARPTETLRPGANRTQTAPEETDPMKLAALVPKR
jgi:hypothetical protein